MDFADLMALDLIDMAEKSLQKIEKAVGNRPAEVAVNPQDITDMKEAMLNLTLLLTKLDKKVEDLTEMVKSNHKAVAYEKSIPDTIDLPLLRDRLEELAQINKKDKDKPKNREDEDVIVPVASSKPTVNVVQRNGYVEDVYTLDEATRLHIARNTCPYNDDDLRFYKDKNDNILCSNNLINLNDGDLVRTGVLKGYDEEDAEGDVLEYKQRINLSYKLNPEDIVMAIVYLQPKKRISSISSILPSNDTTWINNKRKELSEELMGLEEEEDVYTLDEDTRLNIARNSLPYDMDLHYYKDTNDNILSSVDLINVEKEGIVRADTRTPYRGDERRLGNVLEYGTISKKSRYRVIYDKVYLMAIVYLQPKKNISFIREVLSTKDTTWINNKRKELSGLFFTDLEA